MAYDKRITDLAAIAALAAARNASVAPQLLMADITFALVDAVEDGRIILGRAASAIDVATASETACGLDPKGESAVRDSGDAQNNVRSDQ